MRRMEADRTVAVPPSPSTSSTGVGVVSDRRTSISRTDTSVAWVAHLVQPQRMVEGSSQAVVVDVGGPVVLKGSVRITVGRASGLAQWEGEPGQHRRCMATLKPEAGVHRVLVQLETNDRQAPLLEAGKVVVTRR